MPATPHAIPVQEAQGQLVQLVESVALLDRPRVRLGLAAGRYVIPDPSDELDAVIAREFDASGVVLDAVC